MKRLLLINVSCFLFSMLALGQETSFPKDTINLRGIVYDTDGSPAYNLVVRSKQRDPINHLPIYTRTDKSGYFEINGAKTNDTIYISQPLYEPKLYQNKGSRYMAIYLPSKRNIELNAQTPILITTKRILPVVTVSNNSKSTTRGGYLVEALPRFQDDNKQFIEFITKQLSYPEKAVKNNIEGTVEIAFTVEKDGKIDNFKILKGLGYGCDEQVIKALKTSPRWHSTIINGTDYTAGETVSVKFSLTDN